MDRGSWEMSLLAGVCTVVVLAAVVGLLYWIARKLD